MTKVKVSDLKFGNVISVASNNDYSPPQEGQAGKQLLVVRVDIQKNGSSPDLCRVTALPLQNNLAADTAGVEHLLFGDGESVEGSSCEVRVLPGSVQLRFTPSGVDKTAIVHQSAQLRQDVGIGPYAQIGARSVLNDRVQIGQHSKVGACVNVHVGAVIGDNVGLGAEASIGRDTTVGDHSSVDPCASIGGNVSIDMRVVIHQSVAIEDNVTIGYESEIGDGVTIGAGTVVCAWVKVGDGARIGKNVVLEDYAVIAPGAQIEDGTIVSRH